MGYMLLNSITSSALNIGQKLILSRTREEGNPIDPFEYTYWIMVLLGPLYILTMVLLKEDFFPIPKNVRGAFIIRCVTGAMCHVCFLLSL